MEKLRHRNPACIPWMTEHGLRIWEWGWYRLAVDLLECRATTPAAGASLPAKHNQLQINTNPLCIHFVRVGSGADFLCLTPTNTHLFIRSLTHRLTLIKLILVNQPHPVLLDNLHLFWEPSNIHKTSVKPMIANEVLCEVKVFFPFDITSRGSTACGVWHLNQRCSSREPHTCVLYRTFSSDDGGC